MASLISKDTSGVFQPQLGEVEDLLNRSSKRFFVQDLGNGKKQYRVGVSIGPVHYNDDVLDNNGNWHEIDLDLTRVWGKGWRYECNTNGYQIRIWNKYGLMSYYTACFLRSDQWVRMAPLYLCYENKKGERQIISTPIPDIIPIIDNDKNTITWAGCFGEGIDFRYNLLPDKFFKTIIINSATNLPEIIIEKDEIKIVVFMAISWSGEASNNFGMEYDLSVLPTFTPDDNFDEEIINFDAFSVIRNTDIREIFWMQNPKSWDSDGNNIPMQYQLRRYGNKVIGDFSILENNIKNSLFPIFIDTAITEESIDSTNDDGYSRGSSFPGLENQRLDFQTNIAGFFKYNVSLMDFNITGNRFTNIPIPKEAKIDSAELKWYGYTNGNIENIIYGGAYDNISSFSITPIYDIYNNKTLSSVEWNLLTDGYTIWRQSNDLSLVVTEIISRNGWENGNSLVFIVFYNGSLPVTSSHALMSKDKTYMASLSAKFNCTYTIESNTFIKNINNLNVLNIKEINNLSINNKKTWNGLL
jgi:hypothetical protein